MIIEIVLKNLLYALVTIFKEIYFPSV